MEVAVVKAVQAVSTDHVKVAVGRVVIGEQVVGFAKRAKIFPPQPDS